MQGAEARVKDLERALVFLGLKLVDDRRVSFLCMGDAGRVRVFGTAEEHAVDGQFLMGFWLKRHLSLWPGLFPRRGHFLSVEFADNSGRLSHEAGPCHPRVDLH